jgi:hypothetical protein
MKNLYIIIFTVALLIFVSCNKIVENFRGGRRGRYGGRHGGRHGGRGGRHGFNPRVHVRGLRRNRGWGRRNYWRPYWNDVWPSWFGYSCNCKRGCTPDGCANPGNGPYDCVWASDCNCC